MNFTTEVTGRLGINHLSQTMSQEPTITMKELDSYIFEAINQLRSSKKQPNENTIFNLLLEKPEAIAINKEQLTERLNYLVELKVL